MLKGKTILITGANGGLGYAISKKLFEKNSNLILLYNKNDDNINKLIHYSKNSKNKIKTYKVDLLNDNNLEKVLKKITKNESIDIFIHSTSFSLEHDQIIDSKWSDFQHHIELQTKSFFQISKSIIPKMKKKKSGKIIGILSSSVIGRPPSSLSPYIVAKYSLLGLIKTLAVELGPYGITCNGISPSMCETPLTKKFPKKMKEINANDIPLKRLVFPDEIASTVLYLCSQMSNFVNGENIIISGGQSMH